MDVFTISRDEFACVVIRILTKKKSWNTRIARIKESHNNEADMVFPLNINRWKGYIDTECISVDTDTILNYAEKLYKLPEDSENNVDILGGYIKDYIVDQYYVFIDFELKVNVNELLIKFNRKKIAFSVIKAAIQQDSKFGTKIALNDLEKQIYLDIENDNESEMTNMRLSLLKEAFINLLRTQGFQIQNETCNQNYLLTTKSTNKATYVQKINRCICGVVLNTEKKKEIALTKKDYLNLIIEKLKSMNVDRCYDHCLDIKSNEANNEIIAEAFVSYDMLSLKHSIPVTLHKPDDLQTYIKQATFILYNSSRITAILEKYDKLIKKNKYSPIILLDDITEFEHLTDKDSWNLIYNYIMKYPDLLRFAVFHVYGNNEPKIELNIQTLWSFLLNLSHDFSKYYRKYRILMSNIHMNENSLRVTSERLYLVRALRIIIRNTLCLLNVKDVDYM